MKDEIFFESNGFLIRSRLVDTSNCFNLNSLLISTENKSFNEIVTDFQRQLITQVMEENDHVWAKAARQLQLDRGNLHRQAKRLGLT